MPLRGPIEFQLKILLAERALGALGHHPLRGCSTRRRKSPVRSEPSITFGFELAQDGLNLREVLSRCTG